MSEKELACVLLSKSVCVFGMLNAVKLNDSFTNAKSAAVVKGISGLMY